MEGKKSWSQYAKYYNPIEIGSIDGTDTEPHDRAIVRAINSEYRVNRHVKGRPERTIFVSRLSHRTTKDSIKEVFSRYGRLRRFRLVKDIVTGMPKGYAFVEYEEESAAEEAYRHANKLLLDGSVIFVDFECERLLKGWKPRRLGGGFGGKKESGQLRFGGRDRPFKKPISLEMDKQEKSQNRAREKDDFEKHNLARQRTSTESRSRSPRSLDYHQSRSRRRRSPSMDQDKFRHRS